MSLKKPLLFIYPLSPSLQKYLEFAKGAAEDEGFEIYELDILGEALQLVPTVGAALLLGSSPKKVAQILQSTRKVLQQNSSKVLLLTDKALPSKLVQKMQKIGLTEYLPEPVNPKTLIYKVGLLLKSLPLTDLNQPTDQAEEVIINSTAEATTTSEKQRIEKGVIADTEMAELELSESEEVTLELTSNNTVKPQTSDLVFEQQEQPNKIDPTIDFVVQESEDEDQSDEEILEQNIETYYKTIQEKEIDLKFEVPSKSEKLAIKSDNDANASSRPEQKLDLNRAASNLESMIDATEETDAYKLSNDHSTSLELGASESDDESELLMFEIEQAKKTLANASPAAAERLSAKSKAEQELAIEGQKKVTESATSLELSAKREEKSKEEAASQAELQKVSSKAQADINLSSDDPQEATALSLDKILTNEKRKGSDKEKDSSELISDSSTNLQLDSKDQEMISLDLAPQNFQVENQELNLNLSPIEDQKEYEDFSLDTNTSLGVKEKKDKKADGLEVQEDGQNLAIDHGHAAGEEEAHLSLESTLKKNKESQLKIEESLAKAASAATTIEEQNQYITDEEKQLLLEKRQKSNKMLDQLELQGGAGKKKSAKEVEYDWGDIKSNVDKQVDGNWVGHKKQSTEIVFDTDKKNELSIDYRQLKKAFDGNQTLEREAKGKKDSRNNLNSRPEDELKGKEKFEDLYQGSEQEYEAGEDDDLRPKTVYIVETNGIEQIILATHQYLDKRSEQAIFLQLGNSLYKRYQAIGGFFKINAEGKSEEIFSSAHNIEYSGDRQGLISSWEDNKNKQREIWQGHRLPAWADEKFEAKDNSFTYPFYEGLDQLGFAHFIFQERVHQKDSGPIEMMIESARAILLEKSNVKTASATGVDKKESEDKGFFSSIFKKMRAP